MIFSFKDKDTELLSEGRSVPRLSSIERAARRKIRQLEIANDLSDLRIPPGNRLEALKGNRRGKHSIRINEQYRICFVWKNGGAYDVEIIDYH